MALTLTSSLPGTSFAKFEVGDSTCFAQLGFVKGQTGTAGVLEATNAINLHRTLNTYVRATMKVYKLDSLGEQKGAIAKIQADKGAGGIAHYRNIIENAKFQLTGTLTFGQSKDCAAWGRWQPGRLQRIGVSPNGCLLH